MLETTGKFIKDDGAHGRRHPGQAGTLANRLLASFVWTKDYD
jgi:hypothetical protein